MSENKKQEYPLPDMIAAENINPKALEFLYGASLGIEDVISDIESQAITLEEGHKILRQILFDIKRELTEFPTKPRKGISPNVYCSQCLPKFNTCHLPPSQCIANYILCASICQQG